MNIKIYAVAGIITTILFGCASSNIDWQNSSVISVLPKDIQGSTVAIYPLDKKKAGKIETQAIQNHLTQDLEKLGVREVDPRKEIPTYFILFDYATELGITANYENALLIIAYSSSSPPRQVYKAKISIDSAKNNTVENINTAITKLLNSPR